MAIISLQDISLSFGNVPLFDGISLHIEAGQRIGLLGLNGMGKTTLLKLIYGETQPDTGEIARQSDLRIAYLPQEIPTNLSGTIREIVTAGLRPKEGEAQWQTQIQAEKVISQMQLDADARCELLSAGMKRRVVLARGLAADPNLLLLDEPTNHLDIDSINWLETFLQRWRGSLLFVTHDRTFLKHISTRIIELDRGQLFDWDCDYTTFLKRKEALLASEAKENALFDKKLAQEEAWIRRGIQARQTRNEGRVRALLRLRDQRAKRRETPEKVNLQIDAGLRSGNLVLEAKNLSYAYAERPIVKNLNLRVQRGDRIGIIGANGSGKTTLLRLLLGELEPQSGSLRHGTKLKIAYFDQTRSQLDEEKSILENVSDGLDVVKINGRERNVMGYLEGFLFKKERVHAPISALSGGERNRLLLARLFARPANLLVLDEPTNDLDIETLEILEDMLLEFSGTLILVTHDRTFLDNLVTETLVLSGDGQVHKFIGGYEDWKKAQSTQEEKQAERKTPPKSTPTARKKGKDPHKLSYKEAQELAALPAKIEALESEEAELNASLSDPVFYQENNAEVGKAVERLKVIEGELLQLYERWEALER